MANKKIINEKEAYIDENQEEIIPVKLNLQETELLYNSASDVWRVSYLDNLPVFFGERVFLEPWDIRGMSNEQAEIVERNIMEYLKNLKYTCTDTHETVDDCCKDSENISDNPANIEYTQTLMQASGNLFTAIDEIIDPFVQADITSVAGYFSKESDYNDYMQSFINVNIENQVSDRCSDETGKELIEKEESGETDKPRIRKTRRGKRRGNHRRYQEKS